MDINIFDIILLFILAITVSLIIGFNVMFIINKKLSDIKINIPMCPKPNVYIKSENGYLTKVEVDNVKRQNPIHKVEHYSNTYENQIVNTFKPNNNKTRHHININKKDNSNCVLNEYIGGRNTYQTRYVTADGTISNQNVDIFMPQVYMGTDPYGGSGVSYVNTNIERSADIVQIGSIPVNDYNGQPKPTFGI